MQYSTFHVFDSDNPAHPGNTIEEPGNHIVAAEYFFNEDPGIGQANLLQADDGAFDYPAESSLALDLDISGPELGTHTVGVRYKDEQGRWSNTQLSTFHIFDSNHPAPPDGSAEEPSNHIVAAEYFIGNDPGEGLGISVEAEDGSFDYPTESGIPVDIDTSSLDVGTYTVGVRFKGEQGRWSNVQFSTFHVFDSDNPAHPGNTIEEPGNHIVAAEYFFNEDRESAKLPYYKPMMELFDYPAESSLALDLDISGLEVGTHTVGVRYKDEQGRWSNTQLSTFHIFDSNNPAHPGGTTEDLGNHLVAGEYFIGADPGAGNATPLPSDDGSYDYPAESGLALDLDISNLSMGEHRVGVRFKDQNGNWSNVQYSTFTLFDPEAEFRINHEPVGITLNNNTIAENEPADTTIGTLTAIDPDEGDTHTFTLTDPTQHPDNTHFTIDGDQMKASASFDFETKASYTLNLQVTDAGGLTFAQEVTIEVTNVNEAPTDLTLDNATIAENEPANTVVGKLTLLDQDGVLLE